MLIRNRITAHAPPAPVRAPAAAIRNSRVSRVTNHQVTNHEVSFTAKAPLTGAFCSVIRLALRSRYHRRPPALAIVFLHDVDMLGVVRQFIQAQQAEGEFLEVRAARLHRTPEMRSGHGTIGSVRAPEIAFRRKLKSCVTHMAPSPSFALAYFVPSF